MTPSVLVALCGPFDGAHLVATAQIVGLPKNPIAAGTKLMAGRVDVLANGQRLLTVYNRSATEAPMQAAVFERDWGKLVLVLDSPLALCHAARWLAGRLGMEPGSTAPMWLPREPGCWELNCASGYRYFLPDPVFPDINTAVPGISDLTDPAEALAAACVAVGATLPQARH